MRVGFTFAMAMFSASALAHFPLMECSKQGNEVHCQAGYSDGSAASNETIRLFSYDDVLLESQKTDEKSNVIFTLPSGDYYIVFDPGHESAVEVDGVEL